MGLSSHLDSPFFRSSGRCPGLVSSTSKTKQKRTTYIRRKKGGKAYDSQLVSESPRIILVVGGRGCLRESLRGTLLLLRRQGETFRSARGCAFSVHLRMVYTDESSCSSGAVDELELV